MLIWPRADVPQQWRRCAGSSAHAWKSPATSAVAGPIQPASSEATDNSELQHEMLAPSAR